MKAICAIALILPALAGCGGADTGESAQYNDIATGVMLQRERPLQGADAGERATRLAECAGTLTAHAGQTPPPPRADRLRETATRLHSLAVKLGGQAGRTEADITKLRDDTIAANLQLRQRLSAQYPALIEEGSRRCSMAEILRDEELLEAPATPVYKELPQ
jgi:hypothetical protein